jgi:hypothetical protein
MCQAKAANAMYLMNEKSIALAALPFGCFAALRSLSHNLFYRLFFSGRLFGLFCSKANTQNADASLQQKFPACLLIFLATAACGRFLPNTYVNMLTLQKPPSACFGAPPAWFFASLAQKL